MKRLRRALTLARRYPTVTGSLFIILALVGISIYAVVSIPLSEAIASWSVASRGRSERPRFAQPTWTNLFRREKLPETIVISMDDVGTTTEPLSDTVWRETTVLAFDYKSSRFPSDLSFFFDIECAELEPRLTLTWVMPDGRETRLYRDNVRPGGRAFWISQDATLPRTLGERVVVGLFADPETRERERGPEALQGRYALRVEALAFEEGFSMTGRLIVYGGVYGIAGTDDERRDLAIGLLWGTPIALMFGLLATIGTTVLGFIIAAVGSWFGGWVGAAVQRITEVNLMLPFLPIVMMVGKFYSSSLWVMLAFIIGLNIFSAAIKTYRAMFLQVKNAPYIEAARAYGASNTRIIFRYLIPRIVPVLVPNFVLGIPQFVFIEASLAILGLGDPTLPTWGKIMADARVGAVYQGHLYWILQPSILLIITGLSFSMLGFALDRVFNPRLRGI
ncbi:ABC transporter permease [Candidatus Bipolaricaulota bacterium]